MEIFHLRFDLWEVSSSNIFSLRRLLNAVENSFIQRGIDIERRRNYLGQGSHLTEEMAYIFK